jgi:hypothetical protein
MWADAGVIKVFDHVILISLDTLRADAISSNPFKLWTKTFPNLNSPNTSVLDRIIKRGVFFPNAIASAPYTSASHASYFTGLFPLRHGVYEFFNRRLAAPTLFYMAKQQGMKTRFKVDFPIILGHYMGFDQDVDEYIVEDDEAILESIRSSEGPSFNFVHFGSLHIPYGFHNLAYGGKAYRDKVAQLEAEIPPVEGSLADEMMETYRSPEDMEFMLRYKRVVQHHYNSGNYEKLFGLYLEGVEYFLETRFKSFFESLQTALKDKRALIVIFGDHGENYSSHSYGHFNSVEDDVLRVPVVFVADGLTHRICRNHIRTVDVTPTIVDLLGWPGRFKEGMDGESLEATVLKGVEYERNQAVAQAYTVDAADFVAFQRRASLGAKEKPSLAHVLYREAAYNNGYKITRQNFDWRLDGKGFHEIDPQIELFRLDKKFMEYQPVHDLGGDEEVARDALVSILDEYNATKSSGSESTAAPNDIRKALTSMGYNV